VRYVVLAVLLAIALYATLKDKKQVRCSWRSPYANTLQHDIHGEWVCDP
jgi:hypothetical protein